MNQLESVTLDELHELLGDAEGKKPALRVVVAINYRQGVSASEIARWYDLSRTTVYNWLARIERASESASTAPLADGDRPGRPPKLSEAERSSLAATLAESPGAVGLEADEWTPSVLEHYVSREFGVEFSTRHARNLLDDLG